MSTVTLDSLQFVLRCLLAVFFFGAGITHFIPVVQRTMAAMIPPGLRFTGFFGARGPVVLVIFTGVCEMLGGLGLLWPPTTGVTGVMLVIFLIAVFPANAFAARDPLRFGRAAIPLRTRVIEQVALIALVVLAIL
ncbi:MULTISPECIES: hypothetical protein [Cryobacterium]|uniref:DoxX family membrane protein n=1 Tax=Cryobacterium glucosi TaxID=1259175 RepID=A0ABY2ITD3_9MICO|nr:MULTISPECIES: hypothetical protein [Cryobacterium]MDY7528289.1 hypothetical protein [Cryobacterium sp. 10C2]MDY7555965.1 hypothetical protein [Cryobacterium sp. 10C3]MEB0004716.1 hypothetical protein [Cryobacterium sp. RTC2.1]MEB0202201.1 hypothetical protein [Cryobacterium sp. 5I3]MEB0286322.1 hypothetical protein [Cryobacterium sp. 10S3]